MKAYIGLEGDVCVTFTAARNVTKQFKIKTLDNFIYAIA
jgi:hypothetical protein